MSRFEGRNYAFEPREFICSSKSFFISDIQIICSARPCQPCMNWTYTRIIEAGRDRIRFCNLSVFILHKQGLAAMDDPCFTYCNCGCCKTSIYSFTCSFHTYQPDVFPVNIMIKNPGCITSSANACKNISWVFCPFCFPELRKQFFANNRLKPCYKIRVRMRTYNRADDIESVYRITYPITQSFIRRILEGFVATPDRYYSGPKHLHPLYVRFLSHHVGLAHINHTFQSHKCTYGSRSHSVLTSTCFSDDPGFPHISCK